MVDKSEEQADDEVESNEQAGKVTRASVQRRRESFRQDLGEEAGELFREAAVCLAQIAATGFQGTAQRTDRSRVRRAKRHVVTVEDVLADRAANLRFVLWQPLRLTREVVTSVGRPGDQGRHDEGDQQPHER